MDRAGKLLELEALAENLLKRHKKSALLKLKVLYFASEYENLSISIIIQKLGIQKSNFALLVSQMQEEGLIDVRQTEIDRRCRSLNLTEKGKLELDSYKAHVEEMLGASSMQQDSCLDILTEQLNKIV